MSQFDYSNNISFDTECKKLIRKKYLFNILFFEETYQIN
jgi:hypothetical protein